MHLVVGADVEQRQQERDDLAIVPLIGSAHDGMHLCVIGSTAGFVFLHDVLKALLSDDLEHHLTHRSVRLGQRGFGHAIEQASFPVDPLEVL